MADLKIGEEAANHGASLVTHLFNAMLPVFSYYLKLDAMIQNIDNPT